MLIQQLQQPLPILMHKYVEWIVDVKGDGNYGYHVVSALSDKGEESHILARQQLLKEFNAHKESYKMLYGKKEYFDAIIMHLLFLVLAVRH